MVGREEVELNSEKNKHPKKQVLINWEERTVEDSFSDVQRFGRDLAQSLENRVESCVNDAGKANFFDIEEHSNFYVERGLLTIKLKSKSVILRCLVLRPFVSSFMKFAA